jgi:hypothetical protein
MKKALFSVTLLFVTLLARGQQRFTLSIKTDDKITMHGFCYWQELQVKSKDTSFTTHLHRSNPDEIKNLKAGTYTLTAVSLFNGRIAKKIELNKKTPPVKWKGLQAFYKRVTEKQSLSEKLKMNDTLFILYSSSADENAKEKIGITKTANGYKAIQYRGISQEVQQEMQFKNEFFKDVVAFEANGKKANSPKAETAPVAEIYTLALHKDIISFIVPGQWNGLDQLKAKLFIVEQK